ncbi:CAP domain-containing protein [Luteimicrobium sp. NPDC057192]|uniref:CAP domain-containing protein n=1 Tax=Luteimicrobium sp. NPDC057192 TaxID=3346042 RepID=UPI0036388A3E
MTRAQGGIRTWLAALAVAASTLLVAPTAAHASGAGTLAADINAARASAGLGRLVYDGSLTGVAQAWANHMASTDQLAHNPSTPAQIRGGWSAWGENVGFTTTGSASVLHQAFMASAGHRANILNKSFTSLGVGWATKNGHTYVAEVFAAYPGVGSSRSGGSSSGGSSSSKSSSSKSSTSSGGSGSSETRSQSTLSGRTTSSGGGGGGSTSAGQSSTPASAPTATPVHPDGLVLGDVGPKVRAMQVRLGVHGHAVRTDGVFGSVTDRAVRAFQRDAGLTVDGIVGKRTSAALARPAPKKAAPARKVPAAVAPGPAQPDAQDAARTAAAREPAAAGRGDSVRLPLAARFSPAATRSVFANPVAFGAAPAVADETTGSNPSPAAVVGTLLTLAAAAAAGLTWVLRRRRT